MRTLVAIVSLLFASLSFAAAPQSGLWWSPSESGRGYALDAQGNTLVVTTFAYGPDGRMQWYYSDGPLLAGGASWTGTLLRLDNGQPLAGNYVPATIVGNAGTITINFSTRTTGTLTLPGGRQVAIQRQNFGVGTAPSSLLGIWIYTHCTSTTTAVCFMERYSYSTIGQATSTGASGLRAACGAGRGLPVRRCGKRAGPIQVCPVPRGGSRQLGRFVLPVPDVRASHCQCVRHREAA
jgi:hypothetical protein